MEKGRFREDLYFRINMIEVLIPPLRERAGDIPEFIEYFSAEYARSYRTEPWHPSPQTIADFSAFDWPGNVRQLSHVIEQAYVLQMEPQLPTRYKATVPRDPARSLAGPATGGVRAPMTAMREITEQADGKLPFVDLSMLRRCAVRQALEMTGGHKTKAAKMLGVHPNTMTRIIQELGDDEAARAN